MLHHKGLISALFVLIFTCSLYAQDDKTQQELAEDFLHMADEIMAQTRAMVDAKELYVQAANLDPENVRANFMAGDFILQTINKDLAAQYLLRVKELNPEYRFDLDYKIGRSFHLGMNFQKALEYYNLYKSKLQANQNYVGNDLVPLKEVDRRIEECNNAIEFVANPRDVSIENIGNAINSEFEDYAPVLNEAEDFLIFTSRRSGDNQGDDVADDNKSFEDIYYSRKKDGQWQYARNIGNSINSHTHNSNLALSADGNTLFLYIDDINNGDIYVSERIEDTVWTKPVSIGENINSKSFNESSVSLSPDEQTLFFSSNRPGGQGEIDIYFSTKNENGEWERAQNLGEKINTEYNEDGPFIDYDGKTLYFSSQYHKGMGGYDIFKTEYDSAAQEWTDPENLGYPINTPDDDIFFVSTSDGKRGYFASVREDGEGFTDIYMLTLPPDEPDEVDEPETLPVKVHLSVLDALTGDPLSAKVSMRNIENNKMAGLTEIAEGQYVFTVNSEFAGTYRLSAESDGYIFETKDIVVPPAAQDEQVFNESLLLQKPVVNTRKVLRNIYFHFDKATFKEDSYEELNKMTEMMASNKSIRIELSGHTDNIGGKEYNRILSQVRANAVKGFLVNKGIDPRRIQAVGYGKTRPLATNDDEKEGREINRRVEFTVIE